MLERIKEAVTETFGEKCPDFDANCHGCQAWAEVERLDCPPLSGKPMVTDATQLLEQGDRAHAALCRELRIQTSLVGDLTAALRRALSDAPARDSYDERAAKLPGDVIDPDTEYTCPMCVGRGTMDGHEIINAPAREPLLQNVEADDGCWVSCSGCHETNEGYETGHYAYSPVFKCYVGCGCRECGGLGVIWDNTDYSALGDYLAEEMDAPAREVTVREAAKYVTSFTIHAGPENEPLPISIIPIDHPWQSKPTYDASIMVRWTGEMPAALRALSQGGEG